MGCHGNDPGTGTIVEAEVGELRRLLGICSFNEINARIFLKKKFKGIVYKEGVSTQKVI